MGENSKIEWCDHTFNPWMGCTKVSPACAHCYAERDMDHRYGKVQWGPNGTRVLTSDANWQKPVKWNHDAGCIGSFDCNAGDHADCCTQTNRPRVFCASLADVFEDWQGEIRDSRGEIMHCCKNGHYEAFGSVMVNGTDCLFCDQLVKPLTMNDVRRRLFALIDATPNLDWLLLTKRPENIRRMIPQIVHEVTRAGVKEGEITRAFWPNVWLGTSVENQEMAEKRIPELLKCRDLSPVLFLSCEPLLGPVDLWPVAYGPCSNFENTVMDPTTGVYECCSKCDYSGVSDSMAIDWVIAGGESGPAARSADPNWFRSLRDQCDDALVPFFFKQWGEFDAGQVRVGKNAAGRLLDGVVHDGLPYVVV